MTIGNTFDNPELLVSTHMPLARHDGKVIDMMKDLSGFYSHASCEA